jgi:RNA polymerase sigma-70 factor (ECF subfamily)
MSDTNPTADDSTLIVAAQRGDLHAFGEIVRRYQATVFGVCWRLLGERNDAEDAAQESFLRAYTRLYTFDATRPFGPWMRRVAANYCINRLQATLPATVTLESVDGDSAAWHADSGMGEDPLQSLLRQEEATQVQAALAALPPHFRMVIELRHFHGLDYGGIAAEVGLPLSSVKTHLFRARRLLADALRPLVAPQGAPESDASQGAAPRSEKDGAKDGEKER